MRIAAEIMAEHFSTDTLQRMTGMEIPQEVRDLLQNELMRQYRIDVETDSTVAPDQAADQANMATALEAVTGYLQAVFPLTQAGIPPEPLIQLLKVYLRKFKWGREMEEMLSQLERNPPEAKPDPEEKKMQMEAQLEQQKMQADLQKQQAEMELKMQEMQAKLQQMQMEMQLEYQKAQIEMKAQQEQHQLDMVQSNQSHQQKMVQQKQQADAKAVQVRQGNKGSNSSK
jgi:hypothetical protein